MRHRTDALLENTLMSSSVGVLCDRWTLSSSGGVGVLFSQACVWLHLSWSVCDHTHTCTVSRWCSENGSIHKPHTSAYKCRNKVINCAVLTDNTRPWWSCMPKTINRRTHATQRAQVKLVSCAWLLVLGLGRTMRARRDDDDVMIMIVSGLKSNICQG